MSTYHATSFLLSLCFLSILTLVMPTYHATPSLLSLLLFSPYFLFVINPHPSNPDLPRHSFSSLSTFSLPTFSSSPIHTLVIPTNHAIPLSLLPTFSPSLHPHPSNADLPRHFFSSLSLSLLSHPRPSINADLPRHSFSSLSTPSSPYFLFVTNPRSSSLPSGSLLVSRNSISSYTAKNPRLDTSCIQFVTGSDAHPVTTI